MGKALLAMGAAMALGASLAWMGWGLVQRHEAEQRRAALMVLRLKAEALRATLRPQIAGGMVPDRAEALRRYTQFSVADCPADFRGLWARYLAAYRESLKIDWRGLAGLGQGLAVGDPVKVGRALLEPGPGRAELESSWRGLLELSNRYATGP